MIQLSDGCWINTDQVQALYRERRQEGIDFNHYVELSSGKRLLVDESIFNKLTKTRAKRETRSNGAG